MPVLFRSSITQASHPPISYFPAQHVRKDIKVSRVSSLPFLLHPALPRFEVSKLFNHPAIHILHHLSNFFSPSSTLSGFTMHFSKVIAIVTFVASGAFASPAHRARPDPPVINNLIGQNNCGNNQQPYCCNTGDRNTATQTQCASFDRELLRFGVLPHSDIWIRQFLYPYRVNTDGFSQQSRISRPMLGQCILLQYPTGKMNISPVPTFRHLCHPQHLNLLILLSPRVSSEI